MCTLQVPSRFVGGCLASLLFVAPSSLRAQTGMVSPPAGPAANGHRIMRLGVAASGVVQKILVADGSRVDAGQILLQVDCRPLEEETKSRTANVEAAQAAFERTRNGSRIDEIAIGEANVGVAQARAEEAHAAFARLAGLSEDISVTRAQLLEVERDARITAAQLEDAKKRVALQKAGSRAEDVIEAQAKRDVAAADLSEARAQIDQCSVRAPVSGVVQVVVTVGEIVSTAIPVTLLQLTPDQPTP
jgi:multidrug resistance efflux pump